MFGRKNKKQNDHDLQTNTGISGKNLVQYSGIKN
jgi:hypothetical protein